MCVCNDILIDRVPGIFDVFQVIINSLINLT